MARIGLGPSNIDHGINPVGMGEIGD